MKNYLCLAAACCISLTGCSSSSSSSDNSDGMTDEGSDTSDTVLAGVFIDSAVEGLSYSTSSQNGITDEDGTLNYLSGEEVTLSIGQLSLPSFEAAETMTPLNVFGVSEVSDVSAVNLAILLQSMDADSNPENGIEILESAGASAPASIDFSQDTAQFVENESVINLVANSGATTPEVIAADDASRHLQSTLAEAGALESLTTLDYTNAVIGNTATYGTGGVYYYRADGVRFAMEEPGVVVETIWTLDESGNICETTTRETIFCIADPEDAPNLMLTRTQGSSVYNYSDDNFVGVFTVSEGDSQGLSN